MINKFSFLYHKISLLVVLTLWQLLFIKKKENKNTKSIKWIKLAEYCRLGNADLYQYNVYATSIVNINDTHSRRITKMKHNIWNHELLFNKIYISDRVIYLCTIALQLIYTHAHVHAYSHGNWQYSSRKSHSFN